MAYAMDRGYSLGTSKDFVVSGTLVLHHCGGQFVKTDPDDYAACVMPYDSGWVLGDTINVFSKHCEDGWPDFTGTNGHYVKLSAFGVEATLITGGVDRDPPNADYAWRTAVIHKSGGDTDIVRKYDDLDDPDFVSITPQTVEAGVRISFRAEAWLFEQDFYSESETLSYNGAGLRPQSPRDPRFHFVWKITSDVTSIVDGDSKTLAKENVVQFAPGYSTPDNPGGIYYLQGTNVTQPFVTVIGSNDIRGQSLYGKYVDPETFLPESIGKDNFAPGTILSEARGLYANGQPPYWTGTFSIPASENDPCAITDEFSNTYRFESSSTPLDSLQFKSRTTPSVDHQWFGHQSSEISLKGTIRDWEHTLYGFPVKIRSERFVCDELNNEDIFYAMSNTGFVSASEIAPIIDFGDFPTYDNQPHQSELRYGEEWRAISFTHKSTLTVEDFSKITGSNSWVGTNATVSRVSSHTHVIASGVGTHRFKKTLKNDFFDLMGGISVDFPPAVYWAAHRSNWSGLPATLRSSINEWWDATGLTDSEPHIGDWWKVGCRLLAGSDIYNWSSYRYAYLKASADTACTITMNVKYRSYTFTDVYSDNSPAFVDNIATYEIDLTTAAIEHEIDLPSRSGDGGQEAFRYIVDIEFVIPDGRTVDFYTIILKRKSTVTLDVHHPPNDIGAITALVDDKHALFLNGFTSVPPVSLPHSWWGWPIYRYMEIPVLGVDTFSGYFSLTIEELAAEISLQEGWGATVRGGPSHGTPNYACYLQEDFKAPLPTLRSRRSAGSALFGPNFKADLDLEANLGNAVQVLVFDPTTYRAVSTRLDLETLSGFKDSGISAGNGAGQLQLHSSEGYEITTNIDTYTGQGLHRTLSFPVAYGTPISSAGNPYIVTSSDLESYVALIKDDALQLARMRGAQTTWEYLHAATGLSEPCITKNEKRTDYPLYIVGHIAGGKVVLLKNTHYGSTTGTWKLKVIGNGYHAIAQVEESLGLLFVSYWRDNNFYIRKSSDEGVTWRKFASSGTEESTVLASVPEQHFSFDFLNNTKRTIIGVYTNGSGELVARRSDDLGDTWT